MHQLARILTNSNFLTFRNQEFGKLTYTWCDVSSCTYYCLEVKDGLNDIVLKHWYEAPESYG